MVKIIYKDNVAIGWQMCPTTEEEQHTVAIIRDLQYFGTDGTAIEYKGLRLIDEAEGKRKGNVLSLTWIQKKYMDI